MFPLLRPDWQDSLRPYSRFENEPEDQPEYDDNNMEYDNFGVSFGSLQKTTTTTIPTATSCYCVFCLVALIVSASQKYIAEPGTLHAIP